MPVGVKWILVKASPVSPLGGQIRPRRRVWTVSLGDPASRPAKRVHRTRLSAYKRRDRLTGSVVDRALAADALRSELPAAALLLIKVARPWRHGFYLQLLGLSARAGPWNDRKRPYQAFIIRGYLLGPRASPV